jgi:2,4-dienoyl-CoA reductase-like NADH-dependent reductase (Old Yellow Enzyme family)
MKEKKLGSELRSAEVVLGKEKTMPFDHILSPLNVKGNRLPNRLVFPPIQTRYAEKNGIVSEPLINFYRGIARNKIGLTIVGGSAISPEAVASPYLTRLDQDVFMEGFSRLFSAIKEAGSIPAVQLSHRGRQSSSKLTGFQPVAPSPIPCPVWGETPRELTQKEIERLEDQFARGALRAKLAGAEMVEFHAAHGYLINQFLSPYSNRRTDDYGGTLENRTRFLTNILRKTKENVGSDFPVICRISADEFVKGGLTLSTSKEIASLLTERGMDIISVSAGVAETFSYRDTAMKQGDFLNLSKGIKEVVRIPVIVTGKIMDLNQAEKILEGGIADLVGIGRAIIADPELIPKTLENREHEIKRCIECGECITSLTEANSRLRCLINEEYEKLWKINS